MLRPKKKNHCPCSGQHKKHCPCSRPLLYSGQARLSAVHQWAKGSNAAGEDRGAAKSSNRRRVPPVFRRTVPDPLGQKRDNSGYALGRGLATAATHQSSMGRSHSKPAYRRTDHPPPSCSTHSACVPAQRPPPPVPPKTKPWINNQTTTISSSRGILGMPPSAFLLPCSPPCPNLSLWRRVLHRFGRCRSPGESEPVWGQGAARSGPTLSTTEPSSSCPTWRLN